MESLFELWSRRDPNWEIRYQESIMDIFVIMEKGVILSKQLVASILVRAMKSSLLHSL